VNVITLPDGSVIYDYSGDQPANQQDFNAFTMKTLNTLFPSVIGTTSTLTKTNTKIILKDSGGTVLAYFPITTPDVPGEGSPFSVVRNQAFFLDSKVFATSEYLNGSSTQRLITNSDNSGVNWDTPAVIPVFHNDTGSHVWSTVIGFTLAGNSIIASTNDPGAELGDFTPRFSTDYGATFNPTSPTYPGLYRFRCSDGSAVYLCDSDHVGTLRTIVKIESSGAATKYTDVIPQIDGNTYAPMGMAANGDTVIVILSYYDSGTDTTYPAYAYSNDGGASFTTHSITSGINPASLTFCNGNFIYYDSNNYQTYLSPTGIDGSWTAGSTLTLNWDSPPTIMYGISKYIYYGQVWDETWPTESYAMYVSDDGLTGWTQKTVPVGASPVASVYDSANDVVIFQDTTDANKVTRLFPDGHLDYVTCSTGGADVPGDPLTIPPLPPGYPQPALPELTLVCAGAILDVTAPPLQASFEYGMLDVTAPPLPYQSTGCMVEQIGVSVLDLDLMVSSAVVEQMGQPISVKG
jgi:hypothetical protein